MPSAELDTPTQDAGSEAGAVDEPGPRFAQVKGTGIERCEDPGAATDVALQVLPSDFVGTYRFLDSTCETLPTIILLRNLADSTIRLDGLGIGEAGFALASEDLPLEIAPGESTSVTVRYTPDMPAIREAVLVVATSLGCQHVRVTGIASSEEQLITYSPTAMDFGKVPVGGRSGPRKVTILHQFPPGMRIATIGGVGIGPGPQGELEATPVTTVDEGTCTTRQLEVTYTPLTPGVMEGNLLWRVWTGNVEGTMVLPVYGVGVGSN